VSNVLPQGWEEKTLKNSTSILGDGLHGTPKYSENGDYFFINGNNLVEGKIVINEKTKRCSIEEYNKYKKNLNNRTLFISINGTLGNIAEYKNEKIFLGKSACYFNILEDINKDFVKYVLQTSYFKYYIDTYSTGTTIKNMPLKAMREFTFIIPSDINEQKRIADILSAFDDKIELNNQMNQTLEDMTTTLFANSLLDKKTFSATTLGELVEIKYGKDHKHLEEGNMPLYGSGGIMRYVNNFLYDKESILIPRKGTLGNLFYIQKPFWTVDTIFYTEINTSKVIPIYLYYVLKRFDLANLNVGSAVPSLTKQALNALKLEIPNISIQKKVSDTLTSLHNKILENIEQNQTLKQQRDTLLPKLMSGEIRV
jgi:type I restriction enzyme, S subunit